MNRRNLYIIAGSNGAGKTTFARTFLPKYVKCPRFVNPDLLASGLSPFAPELAARQAGRLVMEQIVENIRQGLEFAFETTLSGRTQLRLIQQARRQSYAVHMFYLWIPSVELSLSFASLTESLQADTMCPQRMYDAALPEPRATCSTSTGRSWTLSTSSTIQARRPGWSSVT